MATTHEDIKRWLKTAKKRGATHVIVACDTFDYEDYPIYVKPDEDVREKASHLGSMQTLMEVYNMSMDLDKQLKEGRSYNY